MSNLDPNTTRDISSMLPIFLGLFYILLPFIILAPIMFLIRVGIFMFKTWVLLQFGKWSWNTFGQKFTKSYLKDFKKIDD